MLVIYPRDPSTRFLKSIEESLAQYDSVTSDFCNVDNYDLSLSLIAAEEHRTILFIGHGCSLNLSGGCYVSEGRQPLIWSAVAKNMFANKKIILLACNSSEFISSFKNEVAVAIGFGNIVTEKEDLKGRDKSKYRDPKVISEFRVKLVELFDRSIFESYSKNTTFLQFYRILKMRFAKEVAWRSLSSESNDKLIGELFFDLKANCTIFGDGNLTLGD